MKLSECFSTLNVGPDSRWEEVKRSYHFLAKKYHPDVHPGKPGMATKFRKISAAYKILEIRHKSGPVNRTAWNNMNAQRNRFAKKRSEADPSNPQMATPLGKVPTPLKAASKNHTTENAESGFKGVGDTFFNLEKKLFLLDIRKTIFLKKRLPSRSNLVRIKKGNDSFQVRIPPGPWTSMFIRVPEKGNSSLFSKKRGDLLLNIQVPNEEFVEAAPAVYHYKVRIPEKSIGSNKVWTLKSATGPIKFTLPRTAQHGQKLILKANQDSASSARASHIMTLSLV
jgi:DnaJ-class molecular chaperone